MGLERAAFGVLPDGMSVEALTLTNERGMDVRLITYGAGIQALRVPDREGRLGDVALGHASLAAYLDHPLYLGSTVGRFANRIAAGRFRLDGGHIVKSRSCLGGDTFGQRIPADKTTIGAVCIDQHAKGLAAGVKALKSGGKLFGFKHDQLILAGDVGGLVHGRLLNA